MADEQPNVEPGKDPVSRKRRFTFIASVTAFGLLSALIVTLIGVFFAPTATVAGAVTIPYAPLLDLYVRGVLGIVSATVIAYVTGSVIDYNGGVGKLFSTQPKG